MLGTTGEREEADKAKVSCGLLGGDARPLNTHGIEQLAFQKCYTALSQLGVSEMFQC